MHMSYTYMHTYIYINLHGLHVQQKYQHIKMVAYSSTSMKRVQTRRVTNNIIFTIQNPESSD